VGVAKAEDATIGGDEPIPTKVGGLGHADDRLVEDDAARRAEEGGVPKGKDAAVRGDQPIPESGAGLGNPHNGGLQPRLRRITEE
jgi:hypothetical protein